MGMGGLYYEDFTIGMRFEHVLRRTVTEADNLSVQCAHAQPGGAAPR